MFKYHAIFLITSVYDKFNNKTISLKLISYL